MSKSSPPVSSIASPPPKTRRSEASDDEIADPIEPGTPKGRTFHAQFAAAVRWLHIYVSLLGFATLLFFAVTGITLNHPTWFGIEAQRTTEHHGELNKAWLNRSNASAEPSQRTDPDSGEIDYALQVDKLAVVEELRRAHHLRGSVGEFRVDDRECLIVFKGPGYSADVVIDREQGTYLVTETALGVVAIINDLHKGRDTGRAWSWVVDASALLMVFVSITGLVLIFYLRRRRWSGIITAVVGTILFALLYIWFVP